MLEPTNTESQVSDLLVRWHRWQASPVRLADTLMGDLDSILAQIPPQLRTALTIQARNMACGAQVWGSPRVQGNVTHEARSYLRNLLAADEVRWFGQKLLQLNERGNRVGESHHRAKLSDRDVELLLELRDEKNADGTPRYSFSWLAEKFEIAKSHACDICNGNKRGQMAFRTKKVDR